MKLHFFGGGAGESILLEGPGGWGMLDCFCAAGGRVPPLEYLAAQGARRLWFLALTHPHEDHYDGLDKVTRFFLQRDGIQEFWRYPAVGADSLFPWLEARAQRQLNPFRDRQSQSIANLRSAMTDLAQPIRQGQTELKLCSLRHLVYEDASQQLEIVAIAPPATVVQATQEILVANILRGHLGEGQLKFDPNQLSFALLIRTGDREILLGADVTSSVWKRAFQSNLFPGLNLTVLKVCHHGSAKDNTAKVLDRLLGGGPADLAVVTRYAPSRLPSARVMADLKNRFQNVALLGAPQAAVSMGPKKKLQPRMVYSVERLEVEIDSGQVRFGAPVSA